MAGITEMDTSGLVTFAFVGDQPPPSLSLPGPALAVEGDIRAELEAECGTKFSSCPNLL